MSDILERLKESSVKQLHDMLQDVLKKAAKDVVDEGEGFDALSQQPESILETFTENMNVFFDELMGKTVNKPEPVYNFETLSLVQDAELEVMVALEGMVNSARNTYLPNFISLNTRLGSLFPEKCIDESTNPLDPSQIAEAFQEAIRPLGLDTRNNLSVYRQFNADILRNLGKVLTDANRLLIEGGVIPDLGMDGINRQRAAARIRPRKHETGHAFGTVEEDPYNPAIENPELFSMMQNLLHPGAAAAGSGIPAMQGQSGTGTDPSNTSSALQQYAVPASFLAAHGARSDGSAPPFVPAAGEQVQLVDQAKLLEVLTNIQKTLEERTLPGTAAKDVDDVEKLDISSTLGEMLKEDDADGVVNAVDRQSSDIINLVTLLYEAIWDDESVPIPIKELIGRTQITIIKVALSDTTFFNKEDHPARMVLNEFAEAGIGWTEVDALEDDPLYQKIQDLVHRILADYAGDVSFFEEIIKEFRGFRAREAAKARALEQRIMRAKERKERIDDINELVSQKVNERVLGRELHAFIKEMLEGPFHKFMVMLVVKEGPGTNAWKQAINTIDVLLWTVQPHDHKEDRKRLETVNPRLLNNLRKAFRIARLDPGEIDELIDRLEAVQEESFVAEPATPVRGAHDSEDAPDDVQSATDDSTGGSAGVPAAEADIEFTEEALTEDDPHVMQVDKFHVGIWVEFVGEDDTAVRCKLAARINAIDKYIFVNRQGVKVVEKTRMGLAQELRDGTVKLISDGLLFSRALETVIGNLRVSQREQQSGSAYQPEST